jgi:DNA-directed RNA polymerase subunit RPC12/RpoP
MQWDIRITCHRCGHEKTYMGSRLELIQREKPQKPARIWCPRCRAMIRLDTLFAAAQKEEQP